MAKASTPAAASASSAFMAAPASPITQGMMGPSPRMRAPAASRQDRRRVAALKSRARRSSAAATRGRRSQTAAAKAGASAVENTNERARFQRNRRRRSEPQTKAPCSPNDFPNVPTSTSGRTPSSAQRPRPASPQTPTACASSTTSAASCASAIARSTASGAQSPSMLKYDSVTTKQRLNCARCWRRARSSDAPSQCSKTATVARDNRQPSMMDAWFKRSDKTRSPGPASDDTTPTLAA